MNSMTDTVDYEQLLEEYCQSRDVELRNTLLAHYLYIAEIAAKKFVGRGVDYDDLYQVASLALIRALERYDIARGVKFGSFATPSVIGEIKNYFRDRSRSIRLPRRANEMLKKMYEVQEALTLEFDRPPKPEEIAVRMDVRVETVYELMEVKANARVLSLDEVVPGNDGDRSLGDMIGVESEEFVGIENADFLRRCLAQLNDEEREVLLQRYVQRKSQRTIAEEMNVSQMYISRLERKVLDKLREKLMDQ
ncbi:sigma-70 family RNA polymerase sigma factor [Christensenellaceae bacterium OttesenSCG-928-L17]|nr:sigma-70 family RNA polymerase sigma factor [Christensenellaceae bacterium OttesenSCG-928-L17]